MSFGYKTAKLKKKKKNLKEKFVTKKYKIEKYFYLIYRMAFTVAADGQNCFKAFICD